MGGEAFERSQTVALARKMSNRVDESKSTLIVKDGKKEPKTHVYTRWGKETKNDFNKYFRRGKVKYNDNKDVRQKIFALLMRDSFGPKTDLLFTVDGIIFDKAWGVGNDILEIIPYDKITDENNRINWEHGDYKNKEVNIGALYDLIQELAEMTAVYNNHQKDEESNDRYLGCDEIALLESNFD